ncbi:MAG: bifunctional glutamate N-acetyltransferase/amino-acid acetyltransferase ArgJ [Candidatus Goldiibacteriota bacterium]
MRTSLKKKYILPSGFKSSGIWSGVRNNRIRPDTGVIMSDVPCSKAMLFTRSRLKSEHIKHAKTIKGRVSAVFANSGNANVFVGPQGGKDILLIENELCRLTGLKKGRMLFASTGIIGKRLPVKRMLARMRELVKNISDKDENFPAAIMTTDTKEKAVTCTVKLGGKTARITAAAKGAGMMAPDMATMLVFVMTDAAVSGKMLYEAAKKAADISFNRVTIDGDMSPNDTVYVLANHKAGNRPVKAHGKDFDVLSGAMKDMFYELAEEMAMDGEGATKFIRINIKNAASPGDAQKAALKAANSLLVKTAFFGEALYMGRIISALASSGAVFLPEKADVFINGRKCIEKGAEIQSKTLVREMKKRRIEITADLKAGSGEYFVLTTDLSHDYVKINADYS